MARFCIFLLIIAVAVAPSEAQTEWDRIFSRDRNQERNQERIRVLNSFFKGSSRSGTGVTLYSKGNFDVRVGPIRERYDPVPVLSRSTPSYDGLGVQFRWRFRRDSESATPVEQFRLVDISRDGFIDVCEWTAEGGSLSNFMEFLQDDDTDGDEMISFDEFPKVERGDEKTKGDSGI